jgi:hypothetical protein
MPVLPVPGGDEHAGPADDLEEAQRFDLQARINQDFEVIQQHDVALGRGDHVHEEPLDLSRLLATCQFEHALAEFQVDVEQRKTVLLRHGL